MAADPDSNEWTEEVRTIQIPQKHRGIGIGTNRQGPPHTITSIQVGSAIARNGNVVVGDLITHIESLPNYTMNHADLHRALKALSIPQSLWASLTHRGKYRQSLF